MDRRYVNKLLRQASQDPERLVKQKKFWKLELWPRYLRRCDDLLYSDPRAGLALTKPAPILAARIDENASGASGADLMILAYSYLGGAYRRNDDIENAEGMFRKAQRYKESASPKALAEHLRRLAYLQMVQRRPEAFSLIGDAIAINKRGNLVDRHALGECLLCRGHAYYEFGQPGKSLEDLSAALNHISPKVDLKPYYCALHNLAGWAVDHGSDEELNTALGNLRPALLILNTLWGRPYAKLKLRWLIAVVEVRLGDLERAEAVFLEVRDGLLAMELGYEVGMLSIDLGLLYLAQGRDAEAQALAHETAAIFRRLKVEARVQEALEAWSRAEHLTEGLLRRVRGTFASNAEPIPSVAA